MSICTLNLDTADHLSDSNPLFCSALQSWMYFYVIMLPTLFSSSRGSADGLAFNLCLAVCQCDYWRFFETTKVSSWLLQQTCATTHLCYRRLKDVWKPTASLEFPLGTNWRTLLQADAICMTLSAGLSRGAIVSWTHLQTLMPTKIKSQYKRAHCFITRTSEVVLHGAVRC